MTTATPPLRILIADDHDVVREGTRTVIERQPGWEVCGLAATGLEAVEQALALKPDIVVMDMTMPELNGLDRGGNDGERDRYWTRLSKKADVAGSYWISA
jgi:AmiR/NasT family two-component response regulator